MIGLLFSLLIFACVLYAVWLVLNMLPLPQPIKTIAALVFGIIGLIILWDMLTGGGLSLGLRGLR